MNIVGHVKQRSLLKEAVLKNRLHHSLLFAGKDGIGKKLVALELVASLLDTPFLNIESHPDLHLLKPEGKLGLHSIQALRNFSEEVYLSPYKALKKVFLIEDAERMNPVAANALLKTLEEPASHSIIILLSSSPNDLLQTILSRCQTIHFNALSQGDVLSILKNQWNIPDSEADSTAFLSEGSLSFAKKLLDPGFVSLQTEFLELIKSIPHVDKLALREATHSFTTNFEARRENYEKLSWKEREATFKESNVLTQESLEKGLEGEMAVITLNELKQLIKIYLSWMRDLSLFTIDSTSPHLVHKNLLVEIQKHIHFFEQRSGVPSYSTIESHVQSALLGYERQLKLTHCLEALFLKSYS